MHAAAPPSSVSDANVAALKLIGYNRREVVGRDINVIIPDPVGPVHGEGGRVACASLAAPPPLLLARVPGEILEAFMGHGQETLSGTSRYYFVM